jgi:putative addiction module antidote
MKVKVRKFKEKLGVVFPDEVITSLGWEPGDVLDVEVEDNGLKIVRVETAFDRAMRIAKDAMDEYREALQALAKS